MTSLKVLCTIGLQGAFASLQSKLESVTQSKIDVKFGVATTFKRDIENGTEFDVALLTRSIMEELVRSGNISSSSVVDIARSGLGLAVRKGAHKPDIASVEALKRTLLAADSVASSQSGLAGMYFMDVIEQLKIADLVKPKLRLETTGGYAAEIAARGDAEMAVQLISEILPVTGVELVGPFPSAIQKYAVLSAGQNPASAQPTQSATIISYLLNPLVDDVLSAHGLERCR